MEKTQGVYPQPSFSPRLSDLSTASRFVTSDFIYFMLIVGSVKMRFIGVSISDVLGVTIFSV